MYRRPKPPETLSPSVFFPWDCFFSLLFWFFFAPAWGFSCRRWSIIPCRQSIAWESVPRLSMSPSSTACSPLSTVPISMTSSSVFIARSWNRWAEIPECCVTNWVIRCCIRWKYSNVCGTPRSSPFIRTGWMVMVAVGTMKDRRAATASGTPMEWPPPSTTDTVGFVIPATSSARARPASTSPPTVLSRMSNPSISGSCSMDTNRGITCSYLVVLFWLGRM